MQQASLSNMMSDAKFYESYSRYVDSEERYETWEESVSRVIDMHKTFFKDFMNDKLEELIDYAKSHYNNKSCLGAQRALQFGGDQLLAHHARLYNCVASYCDRAEFFGEAFYLMLCGAGVGFSVQNHHIKKLSKFEKRTKDAKTFVVKDTIEGWSESIDVLLSSFFEDGGKHPEYQGHKIYFDLDEIRPKGAHVSGGFKAPGPEPLRKALALVEQLIKRNLKEGITNVRSIDAYDIVMYCADAVISGGVRRSATICLFSKDDMLMRKAKAGNWGSENPQRGRSNNSMVLLRDELSFKELEEIISVVKEFGEPGFVFTCDLDIVYNPCVEVGMFPQTKDGVSGWQCCNLTEINGSQSSTPEIFYKQCKAAAILGTLQAAYTDFKFIGEVAKEIVDKEALIGVGITGWMNNPDVLFNEEVMKKGAEIVKETNKEVAALIGINQAARTTVVKPSGNASVLLKTASGIHGEHSPYYIRNVQINKESEIGQLFKKQNPHMVEDSVWSANNTDYCVAFPIVSPKGSIFKKDLLGVKQLDYVKKAQQFWIECGTNEELCTKSYIRHNVSNTITVDDWDEVTRYVYENREYFCGISFAPEMGDKTTPQSPFTEVFTLEQIVEKYGDEALFTSALIEASLTAFNDNLWTACATALGKGYGKEDISVESSANVLKREFVRRFNKFAKNFSSKEECSDCLKDVYLYHKWWTIQKNMNTIDFTKELTKKVFTDVDTLAAQGCAGGSCDLKW